MLRISEIKLPLAAAQSPDAALHAAAAQALGIAPEAIAHIRNKKTRQAERPQ